MKLKRTDIICLIVALCIMTAANLIHTARVASDDSGRTIRVGFVYDGDESVPYTHSFIRAQHALEEHYGDQLVVSIRNNVPAETCEEALTSLAEEGCDIIFTTTMGYADTTKQMAQRYPNIQFCQATGSNANDKPVLDNYHTYMGEIYQGRYVTGVVAGMKLAELIDKGIISEDEALVGYVAAFPYAEVISGYTAFFLGVRSVVPTATMRVSYTNTWGNYLTEKAHAERLIGEGCVIIAQHSDTVGPAVACENTRASRRAYSVGYNQSMLDVAPTTSLVSTRINWAPYMISAVEAVIAHDRIESHVDGHVHGNDVGAGFDEDWVQTVELNEHIAAEGTAQAIDDAITAFKHGNITVFKGDYVGVDPFDPSDTYDLSKGFKENASSSAPQFHYVLQDVIQVEEA